MESAGVCVLVILLVLSVEIGQGFLRPPLSRGVQGTAFLGTGSQQRWAVLDGIEGGGVAQVDLERIKFFFNDTKVTQLTGQFTEQIVSDVLEEAGFTSFPVVYKVIPRVKMELPNRLWTEQKDVIMGELDALVQGPLSSVSALMELCPVHCINDDSLLAAAPFKILAVEVKSSIATLLSKISEVEKAAKKATDRKKQEGEDVEGKQDALPYWLLQSLAEPLHKVVFINGGQRSKNFILRGGESSNDEERKVWHMLRDAKVSLFYKQSFTQEWTTDLSNAVEHQGATIEHQGATILKQASDIAELKALVDSLLADKEKEKEKEKEKKEKEKQ